MDYKSLFSLGLTCSLAVSLGQPLQAIEINGTTQFVEIPRLLRASASNTDAYSAASTHFFTIEIPEGATEALGQLAITQTQGTDQRWYTRLSSFRAYTGTYRNAVEEIDISEVALDPDSRTLLIDFEQPIPAGTTFTLSFSPRRNPGPGGVYLFQVSGYPDGQNAIPQFIGLGRFHFYDRFDNRWH